MREACIRAKSQRKFRVTANAGAKISTTVETAPCAFEASEAGPLTATTSQSREPFRR